MTSSTTRDTSEKFTSTSCRREVVLAAGPDLYLRREHMGALLVAVERHLLLLAARLIAELPAGAAVRACVSFGDGVVASEQATRPARATFDLARHARPDVRTDKTERQRGGR